MKIRIHQNSIRIRLNKNELMHLNDAIKLEEKITFPNGESLTFQLLVADKPGVTFSNENLIVEIAKEGLVLEKGRIFQLDQVMETPKRPLKIRVEHDLHDK